MSRQFVILPISKWKQSNRKKPERQRLIFSVQYPMPYGDGAAVKWPPCVCAGIYLERSAEVGGKDEEVGEVDLAVRVVVVGGVVA